MENSTLILVLAFLLWFSPFLGKWSGISVAALEIILGSVLSFFKILQPNGYFELLAKVGFLYLMFLAGLEVDLKKIKMAPKSLIKKGVLYVFVLMILSALIGYIFKFNIIITVSMPLISVGLLATLSKLYGKDTKWIVTAFIVGVIGEVASIIALTVLDASIESGFGEELFVKLAILFGFIFLIFALYKFIDLLFWWFPQIKEKLMPKKDFAQQDIRLSMALFFLFIVAMIKLHLELALGAFIAGAAISAFFHHNKNLEEKISSFGFGFLVPLFFIHVGSTFKLNSIAKDGVFLGAVEIVLLSFAIKFIAALVLKKYLTIKEIIKVSLSLSMPLTLIVAVATIGYNIKIINTLEYDTLILAAILEIIIATSLLKKV